MSITKLRDDLSTSSDRLITCLRTPTHEMNPKANITSNIVYVRSCFDIGICFGIQ